MTRDGNSADEDGGSGGPVDPEGDDPGGPGGDAGDADEGPGPGSHTHVPPEEAFGLLSNATRVAILRALDDARPAVPVSFTELYDATDYDDSAGFNYHLRKLVPQFVRKVEPGARAGDEGADASDGAEDTGYLLTAAGQRVVRAIEAGLYTVAATVPPVPVEGECTACGAAALRGSYEDERFRFDCDACDTRILSVSAPPSLVVGRSPAEAMAAFDRWSQAGVDQAMDGICPDCGGAVDAGIDGDPPPDLQFAALPTFDCRVCGRTVYTSFGALATRNATVRSFHRDRGEDLADRPYWAIPQCVTDEYTAVLGRDPWRVQVRFEADGDDCRITFDGDLAVVAVEVDGEAVDVAPRE